MIRQVSVFLRLCGCSYGEKQRDSEKFGEVQRSLELAILEVIIG